MKNKCGWLAWIGALLCVFSLATVVPLAMETTDGDTVMIAETVEKSEQESVPTNTTPEVSWWAKLLAGIGLGPLVAIMGTVFALMTSAVVILVVNIHDRRKRQIPRMKE
jgi:hypothetical protein